MAISPQQNTTTVAANETTHSYRGPLAMVTTLFFMWGFLTCLNDILVPHLKSIFDLNYAEVILVQFFFFLAYAVFSIPVGFCYRAHRLSEDDGGGPSVLWAWDLCYLFRRQWFLPSHSS